MLCGNYAAGSECTRELARLADEKGSLFWKTVALSIEARHLALTGDPAKALPMMTSARNAFEATGAKFLAPLDLSVLASTYAALGKFDDARRCIAEAMNTVETNKEKWFEVEVIRIAGEVELKSPEPDTAKAARVFRARARSRTPTASQILGTPRRNEPRSPLARPGQARSKRANCLLRFTAGSPKASTRSI